jgi:hypothetical protein
VIDDIVAGFENAVREPIPPKRVSWPNSLLGRNTIKWIATAFAALLLAVLILSIPAPVFTTEASARRGCSEGGVCTCSEGKMGCMKTGGEAQTCEQRRQSCMATGCWNGFQIQRCGYVKK